MNGSRSGGSISSGIHEPPERQARTTKQLVEFAEYHGAELRRLACVGSSGKLDPVCLAARFKVIIIAPEQLNELPETVRATINALSPRDWSGGAQLLPNGMFLVLLNPHQTPERRNITLMEEIVHRYLNHPPSILREASDGTWERTHDPIIENEAYWTAAAALLPRLVVGKAVWQRQTALEMGSEFGVSVELVEFRIKTLSLWGAYSRYRP